MKTFQGVVASLLLAHKEAVAVQEVGPVHVDGLESAEAAGSHRLAGGAAGPLQLVLLAARHQHRAAQHADLGVALPRQQGVRHAQEEILCPRLRLLPAPLARHVGEDGVSVGHVAAVGQRHLCALG